MIPTKHCYRRAKQRLGLNKKAFESICKKALKYGLQMNELKGDLRKWVVAKVLQYRCKKHIVIYSDFILLYNNTHFVTVLKIPHNLQKSCNQQIKKAKGDSSDK